MPLPADELLQGTLDLLILRTLELQPLHGVGVADRLEQVTKGVFVVGPGSLFPALHRLADRGWIEGEWMQRALAEDYQGLMARRAKYTPLKRCCTEEDVADSMLSLILHNRFVTGEIVIVDGGFSSTT